MFQDRRVVLLKPELLGRLPHVVEEPVPHLHLRRLEVARARRRVEPEGPRDFFTRSFCRGFIKSFLNFIFFYRGIINALYYFLQQGVLALFFRRFFFFQSCGLGGGRLGLGVFYCE